MELHKWKKKYVTIGRNSRRTLERERNHNEIFVKFGEPKDKEELNEKEMENSNFAIA